MLKGIRLCDTHASCVTGPREFRFQPGYNAVIGPNGSGKTRRRAIIATHHPLLWFGNVIVLGDDPDYRDRCRTRFREELADE